MNSAMQISRRSLILTLPAIATVRRAAGQEAKIPIPVLTLNHATITVADVKRSLQFYQDLFGMPIQARQAAVPSLRIGSGPQCLVLGGGGANPKVGIHHLCLTTNNFDPDRVIRILSGHGITRDDHGTGLMVSGPGQVFVRMRGEENGGAKEGTPELSIGDPDGIIVQLQDPGYCGGAGHLGGVCMVTPEPAPKKGLIAVRDFSHFTLNVSDPHHSQAFYEEIFAMPVRARQGSTVIMAIGRNRQFLVLANKADAPAGSPKIGDMGLTMDNFHPDKVQKTLTDFGIRPRGDSRGPAGPLVSWVTTRNEDRSGGKRGTPELYFTDPDGITVGLSQH